MLTQDIWKKLYLCYESVMKALKQNLISKLLGKKPFFAAENQIS